MTRKDALEAMLRGIRTDLAEYRQLHELLETHFHAALRHDSARTAEVGEAITGLAAQIDVRRAERVSLAQRLAGKGATMGAVFALLPPAAREFADCAWGQLEELVRQCKLLNERNCRLLMDQHEIMQRVLNGEADTYAPA